MIRTALFVDAMSIGSQAMTADIACAEINQNGHVTIPRPSRKASPGPRSTPGNAI